MATDKRLDQVSQLTDFDYALIVKGTDVAKVTKQQLAELVGNLLYGATTKETLASVVAGVLGNPIGTKSYYKGDANDLYGSSHNGVYTINGAAGKPTNIPEGVNNGILTVSGGRDEYTTQIITKAVSSEVYIRFYNGASWSPWQRIDNFGYNSLADLSAGVAGQILPNFKCGYVYGTSKDDNIQIAKDVIADTTKDCSFSVIHKYAGERHVYGYIYGGKTYGSLTIQKYQGQSIVVDINNSEYTIRS